MKALVGLAIGVLATQLGAQTASDGTAIRNIVQDEIVAWNRGRRRRVLTPLRGGRHIY